MAVAAGEEAFDDAFNAGRAFGQRLHVLAEVGHVAADLGKVSTNLLAKALHVGANFSSQRLHVGTNLCSERLHVGAKVRTKALVVRTEFGSQALVVRAELGSQGLVVGARLSARASRLNVISRPMTVAPTARIPMSSGVMVGSGGVVVAVAGGAAGEEALDGTFKAGRALGQ